MNRPALLLTVRWGVCTYVGGPANAPTVSIAGRVMDADHRPAAGAGVIYSVYHAGSAWGGVVARTQAAAQGRFGLKVPAEPGGIGPVAGILRGYRSGALAASRLIKRKTLPPGLPIDLVLRPSALQRLDDVDKPAASGFLCEAFDALEPLAAEGRRGAPSGSLATSMRSEKTYQ